MNRKNIPVLKTLFVKFDVIYNDCKQKECYTGTTVINSNDNVYEVAKDKVIRQMEREIGHGNFKVEIINISMV